MTFRNVIFMIIGHSDKIRDLKRLAKDGNLSHGYVFWGPAMIGKRLVAEALANFLETGSFETPKLLQDCLVIKPSGNTIGIDQVREIKNFLWQKPAISSRRTLVIDDADFMTADAQNALLKIAEEPPASALIVLVTDDPDALNPTVFSRLQKIYFSPVPQEELARWAEARFGKNPAAKKAVVQSAGRPGLLSALLTDGPFLESLEAAEKLSRAPAGARGDALKKMMEKEDFNFGKLLDALILLSSWGFKPSTNNDVINEYRIKTEFSNDRWHRLLELRHEVAHFNLNPRLQIESLFQGRGCTRT